MIIESYKALGSTYYLVDICGEKYIYIFTPTAGSALYSTMKSNFDSEYFDFIVDGISYYSKKVIKTFPAEMGNIVEKLDKIIILL